MKALVTSVVASTILAATVLFPVASHAATTPKPSVAIVSVTPRTVARTTPTVTFHVQLRVKGIVLDKTHIGKTNISGHGHVQIYVDKIPTDAWTRKDLKQHWLTSLAGTNLRITVPPSLIGARGTHHLIVALAQNNQVLYHAPTASVTITVK
jgi:hypothetical protein